MQKLDEKTGLPKKLSPFEIADNIYGKTGVLRADEVGYDPYMMGRICANNRNDVFFAAELNRFPGISKQMSYRFYYEALDKGKRHGRWHKPAKVEEISVISAAYGVNKLRAAQYHRLLGPEGVKAVLASQDTGGKGVQRKGKSRA